MPRPPPLWMYATFLAALVTAAFLLFPGSDGPADAVPEPAAAIAASPGVREYTERRLMAAMCRGRARQRIARSLIERRLTLLDAAERFRDLDEASPDFKWEQFCQVFPGGSDEERHARHVIAVARCQLSDPRQARAVVARLETELGEALGRGTFQLAR